MAAILAAILRPNRPEAILESRPAMPKMPATIKEATPSAVAAGENWNSKSSQEAGAPKSANGGGQLEVRAHQH